MPRSDDIEALRSGDRGGHPAAPPHDAIRAQRPPVSECPAPAGGGCPPGPVARRGTAGVGGRADGAGGAPLGGGQRPRCPANQVRGAADLGKQPKLTSAESIDYIRDRSASARQSAARIPRLPSPASRSPACRPRPRHGGRNRGPPLDRPGARGAHHRGPGFVRTLRLPAGLPAGPGDRPRDGRPPRRPRDVFPDTASFQRGRPGETGVQRDAPRPLGASARTLMRPFDASPGGAPPVPRLARSPRAWPLPSQPPNASAISSSARG